MQLHTHLFGKHSLLCNLRAVTGDIFWLVRFINQYIKENSTLILCGLYCIESKEPFNAPSAGFLKLLLSEVSLKGLIFFNNQR